MSDDRTKQAILARRARFLAAAMVGTGVLGCESCTAQPCLQVVPTGSLADPQPCLSAVPDPQPCLSISTATAPNGNDAGAEDAGATDAGPPPVPCLSVTPRVCLSRLVQPKPKPRICLDYNP